MVIVLFYLMSNSILEYAPFLVVTKWKNRKDTGRVRAGKEPKNEENQRRVEDWNEDLEVGSVFPPEPER